MTTWNPSDTDPDVTLSNVNLTLSMPSGKFGGVRSSLSKAAGKFYFEIQVTGGGSGAIYVGVANANPTITADPNTSQADTTTLVPSGVAYANGSFALGTTYSTGDYLGFAGDVDNSLLYASKNGTFISGSDPVAGSGGLALPSGPIFAFWAGNISGTTATAVANFGGSAFHTAAPSGYPAWDVTATANIPAIMNYLRSQGLA